MPPLIQNFDEAILLWIQDVIRNPVLTPIMQFFTSLLDRGLLAFLICIGLLLFRRTRKLGLICSLSLIICSVLVHLILKPMFARPRPYHVLSTLITLAPRPGDFSFPSGHTNTIFAVTSVLFFACPRKIGIPALIVSTLVGLSRLYLGIHFPTDVLAGALLGLIVGYFCCKATHILYSHTKRKDRKN